MRTGEDAAMRITVVGSGSWGSAFSRLLVRRGHDVQVLTLTREEAGQLNASHENPHFLPGVTLPAELGFVAMADADVTTVDLVVYAVPTQAVRQVARWVAPRRAPGSLQLSLAKGYELGTLKRPSQVIREETGGVVAALSGPNHAEEVGRDMPSATVVASEDEEVAHVLQHAITGDTFRVYTNDDIVGVEYCGAVKNPIAIAVGMSDGLGFGDNSRASLITRSVAEMTRLGMIQGAHLATFLGLAGIGDLIATCTSRHSRNRKAGELLAKGLSPTEVEAEIGQVVEGIPTAHALHDLAGRLGIEMPVTENVYLVLEGQRTVKEGLADLMGRTPKKEREELL
jgi:glycerol-3-phosphate dehydrogenase (NAD(P)+)